MSCEFERWELKSDRRVRVLVKEKQRLGKRTSTPAKVMCDGMEAKNVHFSSAFAFSNHRRLVADTANSPNTLSTEMVAKVRSCQITTRPLTSVVLGT